MTDQPESCVVTGPQWIDLQPIDALPLNRDDWCLASSRALSTDQATCTFTVVRVQCGRQVRGVVQAERGDLQSR